MYGSPSQWLVLIILLVLIFIIGYILGSLRKDKEEDTVDDVETYGCLVQAILFAIFIIGIIFFGWDTS